MLKTILELRLVLERRDHIYDNSVGVKEKVEEVSMKSNDDSEESWGHDHSKCLEQQELSRARLNDDNGFLLFSEMQRKMKMHKVDVERMKRLEEEADRIKMGILRRNKTYMSEAQRSALNALLFRTGDQSKDNVLALATNTS